eukprot:TRINITY_DN20689_c0_g1_i1.p1 TRINITY_DN20689_c0_g1~~TRINITY_DN20689_c0_g1_i1.p1  ORF type:complete len:597 (-),score=134.48 TRINITY_DN20689_c0_g1_i1:144-1934(-)
MGGGFKGLAPGGKGNFAAPAYGVPMRGPAAYGGGVYGKGGLPPQAASQQQDDVGETPQVLAISLTQDSQLTKQGFPPDAPVLTYNKASTVFSNGHSLLQEVVGDVSAECEIHHDTEWELFPEVGEAITAAGGEQLCFSVATCPSQGRWAVGLASSWKGRETAGKMALAFALLADRPTQELESICKNYDGLRAVFVDAGILPPRGNPKKRPAGAGQSWAGAPQAAPAYAGAGGSPPTCWVNWLEADMKLSQDGLPSEGPCVSHDKQFGDLYRTGHYILEEVLGSVQDNVTFIHDPDWESMPELGDAIKQASGEEQCFCVAMVPSRAVWAVGAAGGWKPRETAAKLALSIALVAQSGDSALVQRYPDFAAYFSEAGGPGAEAIAPPAPKRRFVEAPGQPVPQPASKGFSGGQKGFKGGCQAGKGAGAQGGKGGKAGKFGRSGGSSLPKDQPLWVQLPADQLAPALLQELGPDAVAVCTDNASSSLYQSIDGVLACLLPTPDDEVQLLDDPQNTEFPEVSAALKSHGDGQREEPIHVSICQSTGCWGIGAGRTEDSRCAASKVALACMMALRAAETGEVPDLSEFAEFAEFVGGVQPPV